MTRPVIQAKALDMEARAVNEAPCLGMGRLDLLTGPLARRALIGVTGTSGTGKSLLARQIAVNLACAGIPACIVSFEESPPEINLRVLCSLARVDRWTKLSDEDWNRVEVVAPFLRELPLYIANTSRSRTTPWNAVACAVRSMPAGHRVVVIDYVEMLDLESSDEFQDGRRRFQSLFAGLRKAANVLDCTVIAVFHPPVGSDDEHGDVEQQDDFARLSRYAHDADYVLHVDHAVDARDAIEVRVIRAGETDQPSVTLRTQLEFGRVFDPSVGTARERARAKVAILAP